MADIYNTPVNTTLTVSALTGVLNNDTDVDTGVTFAIDTATRKRPEDRLQDCASILSLLEPERPAELHGASAADSLTVLYRSADRERVRAVLSEARAKLAAIDGTRVAQSELGAGDAAQS